MRNSIHMLEWVAVKASSHKRSLDSSILVLDLRLFRSPLRSTIPNNPSSFDS